MSVVTIYVTASTLDEAKNIARTIVGERLVACANILGHVSLYSIGTVPFRRRQRSP